MEAAPSQQIETIVSRWHQTQQKIQEALSRSGRPAGSVKLVVVTKRQPDDLVCQLAAAGITCLGENYPEEAVRKMELLSQHGYQAEWHLIGPVQRRKANMAVEFFNIIHSVDRLSIAETINQRAKQLGKQIQVLLQFNVSGEATKSGWLAETEQLWIMLLPEITHICSLSNLKVKGLMTMPPMADDPEESRPYFRKLRKLQSFFNENIPHAPFVDLSIGTSFDYEVAVEEGATFVRVGEAILGPRKK